MQLAVANYAVPAYSSAFTLSAATRGNTRMTVPNFSMAPFRRFVCFRTPVCPLPAICCPSRLLIPTCARSALNLAISIDDLEQ